MADDDRSIIDYKPDGTVVLALDKRFRLRRPTVGELWAAQEGLTDATDAWQDLDDEHQEKVRGICEKHAVDLTDVEQVGAWWTILAALVDEPSREFKRALRDANRKHARKVMGLWFGLGRDVFKTLSKDALPDADEDLDPALGNQSLYVALLRHWQEVPLGSGRS